MILLKSRLINFLISFVGILVALIIGEILVSLIVEMPSKNDRNLYISDKSIGYWHASNFIGTTGPVTIYTNDNGYRIPGSDFDNQKYDMITVGDSFIFGHLADYKKTFQSSLEKKTNQKILNGGVSGYNLNQTYQLLKKYLKNNNPKTVLVGLHVASDFASQIDLEVDYIEVKYGLLFNAGDPTYIRTMRAFAANYSNLYYWLIEINLKNFYHTLIDYENLNLLGDLIRIEKNFKSNKTNNISNQLDQHEVAQKIEDYINKFINIVDMNLVFIVIPNEIDLNSESNSNRYNITINKLEKLDANFVDLKKFFIYYKYEDLILNEFDVHWNELGHQVVSDAIYETLKEKNLLK